MIVGANQPYFLPYISYWQLIKASNVFFIGDNFAYIKRGWINRNRILFQGEPELFGIEVAKASSFRLISDLNLVPINKADKMNKLYEAYHKAPFYEVGAKLVEKIFDAQEENLAEFLISSIKTICGFLEISTPIHRMSELDGNDGFKREERIYDMCHRIGADTYVNPIGGKQLYDVGEFEKQGIKLRFINTGDVKYKQFGDGFVEKLSILDAIMFNSKDELQEMLGKYELIS